MQPPILETSFLTTSGSSAVEMISDIARRPPGFKTLNASSNTLSFSGDKLITQLEMITSIVASATGRCSISPRRNSVLL